MKYEILESGHYYHIFNKGNNGEHIFKEDKNYLYFLELVSRHILPIAEILSYCLLSNHFHFLVRIKEYINSKDISQGFSNLFNAYAKAINKSYNRSGSLFKRKFMRKRITNEDYLVKLILYIHTNPQHHQIVEDFRMYKYSSYKAYISTKETNISKELVLSRFGDVESFKFAHLIKAIDIEKELTLE